MATLLSEALLQRINDITDGLEDESPTQECSVVRLGPVQEEEEQGPPAKRGRARGRGRGAHAHGRGASGRGRGHGQQLEQLGDGGGWSVRCEPTNQAQARFCWEWVGLVFLRAFILLSQIRQCILRSKVMACEEPRAKE